MNSMFVWAQSTSIPYGGFKTGRNPQLKLKDAQTLRNNIPEIQFIAPRNVRGVFDGTSGSQIVRGTKSGTYNIYGDFPEYTKIAQKRFMITEDSSINLISIMRAKFV